MRVKATSTAKKVDLRERCGYLDMRPQCDAEAELLSAIYRVLIGGGTVYARPNNGKATRIKFNKC